MTLSRLLLHHKTSREPPTDLRLEDEDGVDAFYRPLPEPDELEKRGAPRPILRGRINPLTSWSTRIVPGWLADLNPELDKLWDGGEFRHSLRHQEEAYVWQWHHVSDLLDVVYDSGWITDPHDGQYLGLFERGHYFRSRTDARQLSDARRFAMVCWNRWKDEKGSVGVSNLLA